MRSLHQLTTVSRRARAAETGFLVLFRRVTLLLALGTKTAVPTKTWEIYLRGGQQHLLDAYCALEARSR